MTTSYNWYPSVTAPRDVPMRLIDARFLLLDESIMRIPEGKILCHEWGKPVTIFILGENGSFPLPKRLSVLFFSYLENCFYQGNIELPEEKLKVIWERGLLHPEKLAATNFEAIIIGIAQGGLVQIWLFGHGVSLSVISENINKTEFEWSKFINNDTISREHYVESVLQDKLSKEKLAIIQSVRNDFNAWKRKAEKYNWFPQLISQLEIISTWINYINGDREFISSEVQFYSFNQRAVPVSVEIRFKTSNNKIHLVNASISYNSFQSALEMLKITESEKPLNFIVSLPAYEKEINFFLSNEKTYLNVKAESYKFYTY